MEKHSMHGLLAYSGHSTECFIEARRTFAAHSFDLIIMPEAFDRNLGHGIEVKGKYYFIHLKFFMKFPYFFSKFLN